MRKKENKEDLSENRQMMLEMIRKRRKWKIEKERKPTNKSPKQPPDPKYPLQSHLPQSEIQSPRYPDKSSLKKKFLAVAPSCARGTLA